MQLGPKKNLGGDAAAGLHSLFVISGVSGSRETTLLESNKFCVMAASVVGSGSVHGSGVLFDSIEPVDISSSVKTLFCDSAVVAESGSVFDSLLSLLSVGVSSPGLPVPHSAPEPSP
ncbi:hypothetical protein ALC56_11797 [Trachymyrmex septentrionalis]|uniref:Uncharacterized protein n=1 Tax=Trachymyrmex septentrionalis TaxID=34720 RepID=A0A195F0I4_9HYME|nr:hypothetical protein ALC56_11797 [Trachymyrmex septentrionalis]